MKYIQYTLVCIALISFSTSNGQYQKYIDKADDAYKEGDYSGARKQIAKMQKKVTKKLGTKNPYSAIALIKEAKIDVGLGELVHVMEPLLAGIEMSKDVNGLSSAEHGFIMMESAEVLISYGNFKLASEYLDAATTAFESSGSLIEDIKAQLEVKKAQILAGKGFYSEAIRVVNSQEDYFHLRAKSTEGDKDHIERRKEEFAQMMIAKANSLRKMGNYQSADSAFIANLQWVDDNLKKSHLLWA